MLTGLLLLCVVHGDNLTLDHRRQQHRHHLHTHSCQRRAQDPSLHCAQPRGLRVTSAGALTVGRGRVSVSVISPQEHVEGDVRHVVALLMGDRRKHDSDRQHASGVKPSHHGDAAWS